MKRVLALSLVLAASQTACSDLPTDLANTASPLLDAAPSSAKNIVAVQSEGGMDEQLCTGVLLLSRLVLTARHCLTVERTTLNNGDCTSIITPPNENTRVTVIAAKDIDLAFAPQTISVTEAWLPDDKGRLCGQDLALLYLAEPIDEKPLPLTNHIPEVNTSFTAFGYGLADGDYGQQRKSTRATLTCVGKDCDDDRLVNNELLAHSGACEGDSGGPALDDQNAVFALASRSSNDCNETAYVTFADHFAWLTAATHQAAKKGNAKIPAWAAQSTATETEEPETASSEGSTTELNVGGGCSMTVSSPKLHWVALGLAFLMLRLKKRESSRSKKLKGLCRYNASVYEGAPIPDGARAL